MHRKKDKEKFFFLKDKNTYNLSLVWTGLICWAWHSGPRWGSKLDSAPSDSPPGWGSGQTPRNCTAAAVVVAADRTEVETYELESWSRAGSTCCPGFWLVVHSCVQPIRSQLTF